MRARLWFTHPSLCKALANKVHSLFFRASHTHTTCTHTCSMYSIHTNAFCCTCFVPSAAPYVMPSPHRCSLGVIYQHITGTGSGSAHCGGTNVSPLADGTVYGWTGGTVEECTAKCTADPSCNAFVRHDSDGACHWKTDVSYSTIHNAYSGPGHSCYLQKQGTCSVLMQYLSRHVDDMA